MRDLGIHEYEIAGNTTRATEQQNTFRQAILGPANLINDFVHFMEQTTTNLVQDNGNKLRGVYEVDTIKDIAGSSWMHYVARLFSSPIKNSPIYKGPVVDEELYASMITVFRYIYHD
jgi:hypothetical protein